MLKKKMFRDIRKNLSQFVAIFLMVFLGILVYAGIRSYMDGMKETADVFYKENNLQDLNMLGYGFSLDDLNKVKQIKNVQNAERKLTLMAKMESDEMLQLYVRSSLGFKYNIRLTNQVGIIDSDYYNNKDNEGHIWYSIQNHGDKEITFKKGDRTIQGIFTKYLLTSDDKLNNNERISGFGSTN